MPAVALSPFDALETCFGLLGAGPAPLAVDGRRLGHGLPARWIPLPELRVILQHPAASSDLQQAVLRELVDLAVPDQGRWVIGLAGVLLPGLRRLAVTAQPINDHATHHAEADLLDRFRAAVHQPGAELLELASSVLHLAGSEYPLPPRPTACGYPLLA